MELSLFDLHCDTAYEMLKQAQPFENNQLAVSLKKAKPFQRYIQVMAHWTDYRLDDESGWQQFCKTLQNLKGDPAVAQGKVIISTACPAKDHRPTLLLAVEDARIVANRIERIDFLYENGVRILTPLWKGLSCIGGSHDTEQGLTTFGKQALSRAVSLGMILDISHASVSSAEEIFEISKQADRPVIASHSNAYEICPVSRNLRREQISSILKCGGVIGINLYQGFLTQNGSAAAEDVFPHVDYFLDQGAEHALCLGCDMDGCDLPPDIPNLSALPYLAELMLRHNYSEHLIHAIFYGNAYAFAEKYFRN